VAGAHGFPKAVRLRRRREYLALQRDGQRRHTASFVVIRRPGTAPVSRLGVTVSSRIGGAVVRNRVKRVVREFFRQRRGTLGARVDVVVIAKPGASLLTYAQTVNELERALDAGSGGG
jgi:ribonuclease P protein component